MKDELEYRRIYAPGAKLILKLRHGPITFRTNGTRSFAEGSGTSINSYPTVEYTSEVGW